MAYLSMLVYALLLVGFLYYAQETLRLSFRPAEVEHTVTAKDEFDLVRWLLLWVGFVCLPLAILPPLLLSL